MAADEVRPLPVPTPWRQAIETQLAAMDARTAVVKVEVRPGVFRAAGMVKLDRGWSFMGWLEKDHADTVYGAEVAKTWK